MNNATKYFRNVLLASGQCEIDFEKDKFLAISEEIISEGKLNFEELNDELELLKNNKKKESDEEEKTWKIIIAAKVLKVQYDYSNKVENNLEELTALLYIPAEVNDEGKLLAPKDGQLPWIPRKFLSPKAEEDFVFGEAAKIDKFFSDSDGVKAAIETWEDYYSYVRNYFSEVTSTGFYDESINCKEKTYGFDEKFYIIENTTIIAYKHILNLYNDLNDNKVNENELYKLFTCPKSVKTEELIPTDSIDAMKKHVGQMSGEYPLSPSQRNVVTHFVNSQEGEIIAVSGPPGTGKTTLLQTIVANLYVEKALNKEDAPIIVASSTNNQAVTNIIDSFGKIKGEDDFEQKWVVESNSFATYMPSDSKKNEAIGKGYQYSNINGAGFFDKIESPENREKSREQFLDKYNAFFKACETNIGACNTRLSDVLERIDNRKNKCLNSLQKLKKILSDVDDKKIVNQLDSAVIEKAKKTVKDKDFYYDEILKKLVEIKNNLEFQSGIIQGEINDLIQRLEEWHDIFKNIPWYVKIFKFIPYFKRRIRFEIIKNINDNEIGLDIKDAKFIDEYYNQKIFEKRAEKKALKDNLVDTKTYINNYRGKKNQLHDVYKEVCDGIKYLYNDIKKENKCVVDESKQIYEYSESLDYIRYYEFWLAVHYFESKWLNEDNPITDSQKSFTFPKVVKTRYKRMAMLSPCFVMTFYMLPKNFYAFEDGAKVYIHDLIDLLIVDEAGQATIEVAAPSFSLAKRAIVVGDEQQIPPVYGIDVTVDKAIAKEQGMISDYDAYDSLKDNKISCASSSVMGRALLCCKYDCYDHGLLLTEHRRCFDEIISYCNELLYKGRLEPKRGSAYISSNPIRDYLVPMGYVQVDSDASERVGTSRVNKKEAKRICEWLSLHFLECDDKYNNPDRKVSADSIIAIITPFKAQVKVIQDELKKQCGDYAKFISVGTVHTFQGAEKQIIIFSTVYGKNDGYFFIRNNANLMNVAVSRAKDSFLVFGDLRGFSNDTNSPDGLLKSKVKEL